MKKSRRWDVLIIGGGPAGLAAGIYLARSGWRTALLEQAGLGGQASRIEWIENYPGFPAGISGEMLMTQFIAQARRWGLRSIQARARAIHRRENVFQVATDAGVLRARAVIACVGAAFKELGLAQEPALLGRGVHHAAFDEARRFKGKNVAVVGGGDTAVHQALLLARYARRVYLIHRGAGLKAIRLLQEKIAARPNIETMLHSTVRRAQERAGGRGLRGIEVRVSRRAPDRVLPVEAMFVLIGKAPPASLARWRKPPPGFFVAGDANPGNFCQIAIAAGDGVHTAMRCEKHLVGPCES
ncbi:MAG: NAD(P)/FAD-dependent oxidoreductase [Elusimicrobia bacterium]|nr:NAD(P)/FAD-dependent oxidoreductase [Elusimicrobiota bacterium]